MIHFNKYFSIFISICISIFSCLINIVIGAFFAILANIYVHWSLALFIVFVTMIYTVYDSIQVQKETQEKILNIIEND